MVRDLLQSNLSPAAADRHVALEGMPAAAARADWARWFRQVRYVPLQARRRFDPTARQAIEAAVQAAEAGHAGEIRVVIEAHLPLKTALHQGTSGRAHDLFASLGVWDTALNSGVLLYFNLCEQRVEILADRGIHAQVTDGHWHDLCLQIVRQLQQDWCKQGPVGGVLLGIRLVGETLQQFYQIKETTAGNELSDAPIFL